MKQPHSGLIYVLLICFYLLVSMSVFAQQKVDTTRVYDIPEVIVTNPYQTKELRSSTPTQTFTRKELQKMQALQLSDAVKYFAGVTVKDYGGIGGLKTVSLRSLGAEHTAIGYDGIAVSNSQTGQIDIGRFSLENVDQLSLANGQSDQIFQSARFFASAGLLNIQTITPQFKEKETIRLTALMKAGSWGLANPALWIDYKLSKKWALSVNGEWMSANGRYPYTLVYGDNNSLTSKEKRNNTEVKSGRIEAGVYGQLSEKEEFRLKAYYYQSSRGLPNATTYYYDFSSQHLWDKNLFVQARYKKEFSPKWVFEASGKWNWSYQRYLDPDYKNTEQKQDSRYHQQEYYVSAIALYRVLPNLSFSATTDGNIQTLDINNTNYASPTRYSWLTAVAGKYMNNWLTLSASGLFTFVNEHTINGKSGANYRRLTPFVSASFKPFESEEFRIRVFYKEIFRLPTFNDLYYGQIGNTDLLPEKVKQYNLGITYSKSINQILSYISLTADTYYNRVNDKIVATPTKNLFIWSMVNLGKVEIKGIDVTGTVKLQPMQKLGITLSGNYTYQRALDMTDVDGKTYKHQIAYTPRVSASGQAAVETPWINLSYSLLFSGKRYCLGQNINENRLPCYTDHSVSVYRDFLIHKFRLTANLEVLNLLNKNYEIVKNFPMPGRSVRATLKITY